MRYLCLALAALFLVACSAEPRRVATLNEAVFIVRLVDDIQAAGSTPYGYTMCQGQGTCIIELRRDAYPYCLLHEIRHVFEGNFHPGRNSTEDCHRI